MRSWREIKCSLVNLVKFEMPNYRVWSVEERCGLDLMVCIKWIRSLLESALIEKNREPRKDPISPSVTNICATQCVFSPTRSQSGEPI